MAKLPQDKTIIIPLTKQKNDIVFSPLVGNSVDGVEIEENIVSLERLQLPRATWYSITYSKNQGLFVAVGNYSEFVDGVSYIRGIIAYSTNGTTFATGTIPNGFWQSVTYAQDKEIFVAVGDKVGNEDGSSSGGTAYSEDGITFKPGNITKRYWRSIVYAQDKGLFVVAGYNFTAYSTDGINFTEKAVGFQSFDWQSIVYVKEKNIFVSVGIPDIATNTNAIIYSYDGITFNRGVIPIGTWRSITFGNGLFVAVGKDVMAYSTDGQTFNKSGINSGEWYSILYGNNLFVVVGSNGAMSYILSDLSVHSTGVIPLGNWKSIAYANDRGLFVAVGLLNNNGIISYSTTGRIFTNLIPNVRTVLSIYPQDIENRISPFKSNELLQRNSTLNGLPLLPQLANNVREDYKYGKQTVKGTIKFGDYWTTGTELMRSKIISYVPHEFDRIIFIGNDNRPLALYKDRTPVVFEITSVELEQNGSEGAFYVEAIEITQADITI